MSNKPKSPNLVNYTDDMGVIHLVEIVKFTHDIAIIRFLEEEFVVEVPVERLSASNHLKTGEDA